MTHNFDGRLAQRENAELLTAKISSGAPPCTGVRMSLGRPSDPFAVAVIHTIHLPSGVIWAERLGVATTSRGLSSDNPCTYIPFLPLRFDSNTTNRLSGVHPTSK